MSPNTTGETAVPRPGSGDSRLPELDNTPGGIRLSRLRDQQRPAPAPAAPEPPRRRRATRPGSPEPVAAGKRPPRRKRRARKVHRVVKHIELWSVFKISVVFAACLYAMVLVAGYLLWRAADEAGTIEGIEGFFDKSGGYEGSFQIQGDVVFRAAASGGVVLAIGAVVFAMIGALLFNLISDLTGGIRMTVIDEDLVVTRPRGQRSPDNGSAPSAPATSPAGPTQQQRRAPAPERPPAR